MGLSIFLRGDPPVPGPFPVSSEELGCFICGHCLGALMACLSLHSIGLWKAVEANLCPIRGKCQACLPALLVLISLGFTFFFFRCFPFVFMFSTADLIFSSSYLVCWLSKGTVSMNKTEYLLSWDTMDMKQLTFSKWCLLSGRGHLGLSYSKSPAPSRYHLGRASVKTLF